MHINKIFKASVTVLLLMSALYGFQGCKKDKSVEPATNGNTQDGKYYFTADVNGVSWNASLVDAIDTNNVMTVFGFMIRNKDTSLMALLFDDTIRVNQPVTIENTSSFSNAVGLTSLVIYMGNAKDTSTYYATPFTSGNAGTLTVTRLDLTGKVISGSFNTVATSSSGNSVTVTNGKFNMPIVSGESELLRNLKF